MNNLINQVKQLRKTDIKNKVDSRLKEFAEFSRKDTRQWFSELCFCILTANSKARTAINIQNELKADGFCSCTAEDIKQCIIKNKHRFHNNKTKYIIEARQHTDIKSKIKSIDEFSAREWLVKNIKGVGYKEASHFLRNTGSADIAILDRHILNLMKENKYIPVVPKPLSKKKYFEIEKIFKKIAQQLKMSPAELDMYMWYLKAGEVLK